MSESRTLTELQLAILSILWDRGEGTSREVRDALEPDRSLALTTVATLLSRLEKRGVLRHRRRGRSYVFSPTVTRAEIQTRMVRDLTENLFGGDPAALVSHLIREAEPGHADRLRDLVEASGLLASTESDPAPNAQAN